MAILKGQMRREEVREGTAKVSGKPYYIRKVMFLENGSDESIPVNVSKDFDFESIKGQDIEIEVSLERAGFDIKATLKE